MKSLCGQLCGHGGWRGLRQTHLPDQERVDLMPRHLVPLHQPEHGVEARHNQVDARHHEGQQQHRPGVPVLLQELQGTQQRPWMPSGCHTLLCLAQKTPMMGKTPELAPLGLTTKLFSTVLNHLRLREAETLVTVAQQGSGGSEPQCLSERQEALLQPKRLHHVRSGEVRFLQGDPAPWRLSGSGAGWASALTGVLPLGLG